MRASDREIFRRAETLDEARAHAQDVVRLWLASDDITSHAVVEAAPAP